MSATFDLAEVGEAGVHNLDPTSGRSKDFAGERRKSHGNRDRRRRLAGRTGCGLSGLPVPPCGRGPSARQPVQRDVVEDAVPGEIARGLTLHERLGNLVVAVRVMVEHPAREPEGEFSRE